MIITAIFIYWLIGQYIMGKLWLLSYDLDLATFMLNFVVFWIIWPFAAIYLLCIWIGFPNMENIIVIRKKRK